MAFKKWLKFGVKFWAQISICVKKIDISQLCDHNHQKLKEDGGCGGRLRRLSVPFTIVRRQVTHDQLIMIMMWIWD